VRSQRSFGRILSGSRVCDKQTDNRCYCARENRTESTSRTHSVVAFICITPVGT